jgi:hypothetical protein
VKVARSKRTDELVRAVAGRGRPRFQLELAHWLDGNSRFQAFVSAHQDKIRKKLNTSDEETRLDVRAELLVAQRLLMDRRFEVVFEAYGAQRLGPDLSVTYRMNQRFDLEVTRVRSRESLESTKLANVIAAKLRQLTTGVPNVLVVASEDLGMTPERLAEGARLVKAYSDGRYVRLSGVLVVEELGESMNVSFWPNPEARHPLAAGVQASVLACFR